MSRTRTRPPTSKTVNIPPPIGGWNARDALTSMDTKDAITLENLIPDIGAVRLRPGYSSWATGLGSFVETLMEYAPANGGNKLFAATPTAIYDVTTNGAVGAASLGSMAGGRWQHTMFSTAGTPYLVCCNGVDGIKLYDGSTWTDAVITGSGFTASSMASVASHANRLWFVENNSLRVWYLDTVLAIGGTATALDLGPFCRLGGYVVAMASWTRDGGSGPDDYAVFITSKGEVLIYAISDPSTATGISRVGTYRIAEPIGRRCTMKVGGDLGVLTSHGFVPLTTVLGINISGEDASAVTNKITGAFQTAYNSSGTNFGWQPVEYPKGNIALINVPVVEHTTQEQYVLNIKSGAWCKFTGLGANCWALLADSLFFGGNGTVYKYDSGTSDDGDAITGTIQTAYTTLGGQFGADPRRKRFIAARPYLMAPSGYSPLVSVLVDYDTSTPILSSITSPAPSGSYWDLATWDVDAWGATNAPSLQWQTVIGTGVAVSLVTAVSLADSLTFNGFDITYEPGGVI